MELSCYEKNIYNVRCLYIYLSETFLSSKLYSNNYRAYYMYIINNKYKCSGTVHTFTCSYTVKQVLVNHSVFTKIMYKNQLINFKSQR